MSWEAWGDPDDGYDQLMDNMREQGWLDEDQVYELEQCLSNWKFTAIVSFVLWGTTLISLGVYLHGR